MIGERLSSTLNLYSYEFQIGKIDFVRNQLTKTIIYICAIVYAPGAVASLYRMIDVGWRSVM